MSDIFLQNDGFYFGRQLKSGEMAKGARRITEEEITTMFTHFLDAYCEANGTDRLLMKGVDRMYAAIRLPNELGERTPSDN